MDRLIAEMTAHRDADLVLCYGDGVAYQYDRSHIVDYGSEYWNKCAAYIGSPIALAINEARIDLVRRNYGEGLLLDVGIGAGEFISRRNASGAITHGIDVNKSAIEWLEKNGLLARYGEEYWATTMWDVLEHIPTPETCFRMIPPWGWLFASIPVFHDLEKIRESKHYRPGEHLYYFTEWGFEQWMLRHGFRCIEKNNAETLAGRDSIMSYALRKVKCA